MRIAVLIVVIGLAVAAGLGMLWLSGGKGVSDLTGNTPAQGQVPTVDVLVARADIPLGSAITVDMVDRQPWPRHLVLEGFITGDRQDISVTGMVARSDFKSREPLVLSKLSKPGESSFLAGMLPEGMRAVTLAVDTISGVAGYLLPGDRVDVVFTHSVPQEAPSIVWGEAKKGGGKPSTSEVLLPNLRILAINARKAPPQERQGARPEPVEPPANVTLEMSDEDVKKLRLAEKNGTLSLALRSLKDRENMGAGQTVTVLDLSHQHPDQVLVVRGVVQNAVGIRDLDSRSQPQMIPAQGSETVESGAVEN